MDRDYQQRLAGAGDLANRADGLLNEFAQEHRLAIETPTGSLKIRGVDRRSVVFHPAPRGSSMPGLRVQFNKLTDEQEAAPVRVGIRAVGGRLEPVYSYIPLRALVERWGEVQRLVLEPFFGIGPSFEAGARVHLIRDVDRFPAVVVPAGATGTVVEAQDVAVAVRLDALVDGLEEWGNELYWETIQSAVQDLERITDS